MHADREKTPPLARPVRLRYQEWDARKRITLPTRVMLGIMGIGLVAVFAVALYLNPYDADGLPRTMATHTQLGLPPCNMVVYTGKPCPTCGMTTSFSLLMHGDIANSLKANWAGTLIAGFWLGLMPWSIMASIRGRAFAIRNLELFITISVGVGLTLTLIRWGYVLLTG